MKLKPQGKFEGSFIGTLLKSKPAVIAANWVFQGMRYMNAYEITLKLYIDLFLLLILLQFVGSMSFGILLMTFVVAHSINWIINGHFFVLMRYVMPVAKTEQHFEDFIKKMHSSALKWQAIDGIAIYGSYCRGTLHQYSDLDVRVVTRPGMLNAFLGAIFCFYQRLVAFLCIFPLDVYCCDKMEFLDQLRDDEIPVILMDHSGRLTKRYKA